MSDFLRLRIDMTNYHRVVRFRDMLESDGFVLADALSGKGSNVDWIEAIRDFLIHNWSIWQTEQYASEESPTGLSFDWHEADTMVGQTEVADIPAMGLFDVLRLLRAMTGEDPENETANERRSASDQIPNPVRDARLVLGHDRGLLIPALRYLEELCKCKAEDIEEMLKLQPIFDSLTVEQFRTWNGWEPMELPGGGTALHVPYPNYHPVVEEWIKAVYCTPFYIDPYRDVPGNESGVPPPRFMGLGGRGRTKPEEFFADADLDEVRQYMAVCLRGERWCDGHIAEEFERGVIQAAFKRLEDIFSQSRSFCGI